MSDHIPFEMQTEIIKNLPIKSILQFRSVSKQWKSFIDSPEFINNYHINHKNPHHHLLVRYKLDSIPTYTAIIDNDTFPQQKFSLTAPRSLDLLRHALTLSSVNGLLCFYCFFRDGDLENEMVVIWNPTVRKSVGIVVPNVSYLPNGLTLIGFGACPDTSDPKIVRINTVYAPSVHWEVEVFTLSTHVWKSVSNGPPFKSCDLTWGQVFVDGIIYWNAFDNIDLDDGFRSNYVISFDLKSEKFGELCLPERLVHTDNLMVAKVNEMFGVLECYDEGEMPVCGVWRVKDGVSKSLVKMFTVKALDRNLCPRVLGFRKNGEVIIENLGDYEDLSEVEVYEPSSGRINGIGIHGKYGKFSVRSYVETLLLLDEPNSIVY